LVATATVENQEQVVLEVALEWKDFVLRSSVKLSAQRNKTETKLFQNRFKTVSKLFQFRFVVRTFYFQMLQN